MSEVETVAYKDVWELLEQQLKKEIRLKWNPAGPVVLAVDSEKGGVGKTGLAGGLIAVMAAAGRRVLGVDLDPRATLTTELDALEGDRTVNDLLFVDERADPEKLPELRGLASRVFRPAGEAWGPLVSVLAAERALAHRETDNTTHMEDRLRISLEGVADQFDLVVIDLPPRAGGKLVGAGLLAATHVLFPGTLDADGYDGILEAKQTNARLAQTSSRKPIDVGVLRNIVEPRTDLSVEYEAKFQKAFGDKLLPVAVPKRVVRKEARAACVPITMASGRPARDVVNGYTAVLNCAGKAA